jgi:hypothetical protein
MTPFENPLVDLAQRMSQHAEEELTEEGYHVPLFVLWPMDDSKPVTRRLPDGDAGVIGSWGTVIARAAAETVATTVIVVFETLAASPPGQDAAVELLVVAAADALDHEVVLETPTASTGGRRRIAGERVMRPSAQRLTLLDPVRAFWRQSFRAPHGT